MHVCFVLRVLGDACGYDNWPTGRGIFFSNNKKFLVWVNEEDHLRIISMQQGGNLAEVWKRLVTVSNAFTHVCSKLYIPQPWVLINCLLI